MLGMFFTFWNRYIPTFGNLAFAGFLVAALSGIPLAFSYNVGHAADSMQLLQLTNPTALFFRSIHYWSGQVFLFATIVHVIEHLWKNSEFDIRPGLWLRLVLILLLSFFVMVSGFILKAGVEGEMALQILAGLLETLPGVGNGFRAFILGSTDNLSILYIHHLISTTLVIAIIIFEHVRRAWPEVLSYIYLMGLSSTLAVLLPQGLQLAGEAAIRGPWYFIGLQETLHWITNPAAVIAIIIISTDLFTLLRWMSPTASRGSKKALLALLVFYIVLTINSWGFRDANWNSLIF